MYIQLTYPNKQLVCIYTLYISGVFMPNTVRTTLFKSNKSQAVRLPKAVEMPENIKSVEIVAQGNKRIISPSGTAWDAWFEGEGVSDDFMETRDQPRPQDRESF